ncbi:MAG: hypothetical protein QOE90_2668 [Thermoplasmata archaeon]|jgi:hypothetical protein|nr:hypothetical protein [Thermoplasmata archaeon]
MALKKAAKKAKKAAAKPKPKPKGDDAKLVEAHIRELDDWRGETLGEMRSLILKADPEMVEEMKWRKPSNPAGVPVWSHDGMVCTGEVYKDHVKLTFAIGAALTDPARLFNASLEAGTRRAIDLREGDRVDKRAFQELVRHAVALNALKKSRGK